jgi:hypothetical protein
MSTRPKTRICPRCGWPIQSFLFAFHLRRAHGMTRVSTRTQPDHQLREESPA